MHDYLKETRILDYSNASIVKLVESRNWNQMDTVSRIKSIYNYVRDEIKFGYNLSDDIPASVVLKDGYGQCNTKATLLMALLRATGVSNRIHGFTIDKALQKGAIIGVCYLFSPRNIVHSWVEVCVNDQWYILEGVIIDRSYLSKIQSQNMASKTFCGYGIYTDNLQNPPIEWDLNNTFIQDRGINRDLGIFDTPDAFYAEHRQYLGPFKRFVFRNIVRKKMNHNVEKVRNS